jgi:hypothetical protein
MLKKIGLGIFALALSAGGAFAQYTTQAGGTGLGYPTLNVPADTQCLRYGNNGVCNAYAPAGPTALSGYETVITDTHGAAGSVPQTMNTPLTAIGAGLLDVQTPLTGATLTLTPQHRQLIVNPAGTIAALTVNMPAASATMVNGSRIGICGTQVVTALTLGAGTGNTFNPTQPTAMLVPVVTGAASCFEFIYSKTSATAGVWFRTQ